LRKTAKKLRWENFKLCPENVETFDGKSNGKNQSRGTPKIKLPSTNRKFFEKQCKMKTRSNTRNNPNENKRVLGATSVRKPVTNP